MPIPFPAWRRILALGAHCDDIELGCGGLLLQIAQCCPSAHLHAITFSGNSVRQEESAQCLRMLFPKERLTLEYHDFPDGAFPELWGTMKRLFRELSASHAPDLVLTHRDRDAHQDHRLIHELSWNAFRGPTIWEYEIPKFEDDLQKPNIFVPISAEQLSHKVQALMRCHVSQQEKPWFREESFRGLAALRGMHGKTSSPYAEAFFAAKLVMGTAAD